MHFHVLWGFGDSFVLLCTLLRFELELCLWQVGIQLSAPPPVMVRRLFHISTWTSTPCTQCHSSLVLSFSHSCSYIEQIRRGHCSLVLTVSLIPRLTSVTPPLNLTSQFSRQIPRTLCCGIQPFIPYWRMLCTSAQESACSTRASYADLCLFTLLGLCVKQLN